MPVYSTLTPRSINQDSPHFKDSLVSYVSTTTPKPFLSVKTQITSTTMLSHQVLLLVMLWIWFCWFTLSRPICSIEMEEDKGIVLLGHNLCYPLDLWFSGRFEKRCFDLKWRLDFWFVVWSRLLLPEDLALCFFNPSHLMARDPEVLGCKASPCVTRVTLFVFPMYQPPFMMSQFTGGIVCSSFRFFIGYFVLRVFTRFYV